MDRIILNHKIITFDNPNQIINMGGPWVGNLNFNNCIFVENVVLDNFINDESNERFYFVKYNKISKWESDNFFQIQIIDYKHDKLTVVEKRFKKIFIDKIINSDLFYFEAFYNNNEINFLKL